MSMSFLRVGCSILVKTQLHKNLYFQWNKVNKKRKNKSVWKYFDSINDLTFDLWPYLSNYPTKAGASGINLCTFVIYSHHVISWRDVLVYNCLLARRKSFKVQYCIGTLQSCSQDIRLGQKEEVLENTLAYYTMV
jgi:hypothetical protein